MRHRIAPALAMLFAVACLAACGGGHPAEPQSSAPAVTAPAVATPQSANAAVCAKFAAILPGLTTVLNKVRASPSSLGTAPGALATVKRDARLLEQWSSQARTQAGSSSVTFLPLHLTLASISLHILAAGYRDPGASRFAATASKGVAAVRADCAGA